MIRHIDLIAPLLERFWVSTSILTKPYMLAGVKIELIEQQEQILDELAFS